MGKLTANDDMDLALRMISELNRVIAAADTKAGLLLTAIGFALSGLIAGARQTAPVAGVTAGVLVLSLLVCMGFLAATLRPGLHASGKPNWFSFPTFPTTSGRRPDARELAEQAWLQVVTLVEIANRKHRTFAMALRCGAVSIAVFLFWCAAVLLLGSLA